MTLAFQIAGGILLAIFGLVILGVVFVIIGNLVHALIIEPRQRSKQTSRQLHHEKIQKEIEDYYKTATREQMEAYLEGTKNPRWLGFTHTEFEHAIKRLNELKMRQS